MQEVECTESKQPKQPDVTYLIEPAPAPTTSSSDAQVTLAIDETLVIFCIDVSGSMNEYDGASVSRLKAAEAAVKSQLEQLKQDSPARRVALLTFSYKVQIYGDCM